MTRHGAREPRAHPRRLCPVRQPAAPRHRSRRGYRRQREPPLRVASLTSSWCPHADGNAERRVEILRDLSNRAAAGGILPVRNHAVALVVPRHRLRAAGLQVLAVDPNRSRVRIAAAESDLPDVASFDIDRIEKELVVNGPNDPILSIPCETLNDTKVRAITTKAGQRHRQEFGAVLWEIVKLIVPKRAVAILAPHEQVAVVVVGAADEMSTAALQNGRLPAAASVDRDVAALRVGTVR